MASSHKTIAAVALTVLAFAGPAAAQGHAAGGGHSGSVHVAAPRGGAVATRGYGVARPYGPYAYRPYYGYRGYYPYYGYRPYYGYYGYPYAPAFGLSFYFGHPYGYGYPGYAYGPAYGYYSVAPDRSYGVVRIAEAPPETEVHVDGYYAGLVGDNIGGVNLEAGAHHIEVQLHAWRGRLWTRVSAQIYNDRSDIVRLADAVSRRS